MTSGSRPGYHFTVPRGWINDPLGVTWHESADGGRYELFYQYNPEAPAWSPRCRWGQATGEDLVRWRHPRTALEPGPDEAGCWSGSVVVDGGVPVLVYTSVVAEALELGRVALAPGRPDWSGWAPDAAGPVLAGPPPELDLVHFRDPFVWRADDGWRMVVGGGRRSGEPVVVQYSSPDLRTWHPDGVLVAGPAVRGSPDLGAVWECPQLFPLDGAWVLLVSVWREQVLDGVAAAVGDYDGRRFTPRSWQRLANSPVYATTAFADAAGRRCALSWLREPGPADAAWAGALTVPWLLGIIDGRLGAAPHPDVDSLRTGLLAERGPTELTDRATVLGGLPPHLDVELRRERGGGAVELALGPPGTDAVRIIADDPGVVLVRQGSPPEPLPEGSGSGAVRLLVDGGVVEVFAGGVVAAVRMPISDRLVDLALRAPDGRALLTGLVVHGMEPVSS